MKYALYLLLFFSLFACKEEEPEPETIADLEAYIADNNLNANVTSSGLYYIIDEPGTGARPTANSNVTVKYRGYYMDGSVFDQNTASFNLQGVIPGWTEGITFFKEGGKGMLLIPPHLGYGNYGSPPAGKVLLFDIELISVN
jgi:FKBP-type peptidyl-prolyl cis-trans isomerase